MGQDCKKFIKMSLESVKGADNIVYIDGGSTDGTLEFIEAINPDVRIIHNLFDQDDVGMNGKQRNCYLNYVKEKFPDEWVLAIDADEVVGDVYKLKEFVQKAPPGLYSVHMRHFQNDLGHEDATRDKHFVPNRLFKVSEAHMYPEVEHSVLIPKNKDNMFSTDVTTIWHLAYIPNLFEIVKRYDNHMRKSNIHTPEFLDDWKDAHLLGIYPRKPVDVTDIPSVILKNFKIEIDKYYFKDRGIEVKHPLMVKQWNDHFKPGSVLDLGCGRGPYLFFWNWFVKCLKGIELSEWAVNHAFHSCVVQGDITKKKEYANFDLITAIDVLEHLNDEELGETLKNMIAHGKCFLFSIPFKGDPNLEKDKTHKQFRSKLEWISLLNSYGFNVELPPKDWLFAEQLLVGRK